MASSECTSNKSHTCCAVRSCRVRGQSISFFRFPKDRQRAELWLKACNREDLLDKPIYKLSRNYRLCETHFDSKHILVTGKKKLLFNEASAVPTIFSHQKRPTDIEVIEVSQRKIQFLSDITNTPLPGSSVSVDAPISSNLAISMLGEPARLEDITNPDWVPTQHMGYEPKVKQERNSESCSNEIGSSSQPLETEDTMEDEKFSLDDQLEEKIVCEIKTSDSNAEEQSVAKVEIPNGDITIKISRNLCRLCLENSAQMWYFFSIITLDDQSTIDVSAAFQKLTGEQVEENGNTKLPKHICQACIHLLVNAYLFQQKYETSSAILRSFLKEDCDTSKDANIDELSANGEELSADESVTSTRENSFILETKADSNQPEEIIEKAIDVDLEDTDRPQYQISQTQEAILHSCPICLKQFTALALKRHCQSHQSLQRYLKAAPKFKKKVRFFARPQNNVCLFYRKPVSHTCPFCSEEFDSNTFLVHVRQHRLEGNFRCNICNRIFLGRNHLKYHQLSHKKEPPYTCPECGKGFFKRTTFDFHKLSHTMSDDLPFKCKYCMKGFSNPEPLKRHVFNHENDITYGKQYNLNKDYVTCRHCQQKLKSSVDLEQHTCRFCCAKCHKIFDTKREFSKHVCKYQLKPSQCGPCGKTFQLPSSQRAHRNRCGFATLCYVCGKNVSKISRHLQSHFGRKKSYICANCGKQFPFRESLVRHTNQVHLKNNFVQCRYCPKSFGSKWNLIMHERLHVGKKNHKCNVCEKTFVQKSYLKRHMAVHVRLKANGCT